MISAPWMKGLGPSPQGIRPARQVLRPVSFSAPGCVKLRDVAQASHSPPRKARHASVAPADESAALERLGAAAPTEVLVALLGDVKQDLDRMHWVLIIPGALVGSAVAAGAATLAGLWPGPLGCDTTSAEHRPFGYQAGAFCIAFGGFVALILRVCYAITRHLLALEAVAREFRVQLAALMEAGASAAGNAPQGHPYGRHDLHQLYSAQAKSLFLMIYVLAAAVGGGGAPLFMLGGFCPSGPQLPQWSARIVSLACAIIAYVLPLFCFASGGFGLKPWFGPGVGVEPSGREHPRVSVSDARATEAARQLELSRQLAATAAMRPQHQTVGFDASISPAGGASTHGTPRAGPQRV